MIYQRADGKIITTAAGKLYTGACPPPPNCCRGWDGEPPWGPGGPPPWWDPSPPANPTTATACPESCSERSDWSRCNAAAGEPLCFFCCCPVFCDPGNIYNGRTATFRFRIRFRYRADWYTGPQTGRYTIREIDVDNEAVVGPPAPGSAECYGLTGTQTVRDRVADIAPGFPPFDVTTTFTNDPEYECPPTFRSVSGVPPAFCIGSSGGSVGVPPNQDILTQYADCKRATFRRLGTADTGEIRITSEQVYSAQVTKSSACGNVFRSSIGPCAGLDPSSGGGGNLP